MRFLLLLLLSALAAALLPAGDLALSIDDLTAQTRSLIKPAGQLTSASAPSLLLGLRDVVNLGAGISSSLEGVEEGSYTGEDGDAIVSSVKKLSAAFQDFLDALFSKGDVFARVPVLAGPFRIALALVRQAFNDFTGSIIASLSDEQANEARSAVQQVDGKFTRTLTITQR
ncbi:hypothetical protein ACJZ2D_001266 [Fusarium nematophilum]